jgi:two-component system response regulator BaeR
MTRILMVEDDAAIAEAGGAFMDNAGMNCAILSHGGRFMETFERYLPDLIILDVMLPNGNGLEICKAVRAQSDIPIILLTGCSSEQERIAGFEAGADAYICKPFSAPELVLRTKAILRRRSAPIENSAQNLVLDPLTHHVSFDTKSVELTAVEFAMLSALFSKSNQILSRCSMKNVMYKDNRVVSDRTVDSHVRKLRQKLNTLCPEHELVTSVYGSGYKFSPITL